MDDEEGCEETISLGAERAAGGYVTESARGTELELICVKDGRVKQEEMDTYSMYLFPKINDVVNPNYNFLV